ncbi:MAG: hypothetical protein ABF291_19375 [Desulfobacterales bacterium]
MNHDIDDILVTIGEEFGDNIGEGVRNYLEVDIGRKAEQLGRPEIGKKFRNVYAMVPLKKPTGGMKVRIDGRTFVDYAQFESGVVVPGYVAREVGLTYKTYVALDSMILNFA